MAARNDGPQHGSAGSTGRRGNAPSAREGDVGEALRTVYGDTLKEDIPAEMLALLGKLG